MGLFDFFKPKQDNMLVEALTKRVEELERKQVAFLTTSDLPNLADYAKRDDLPSVEGLAKVTDIKPVDTSEFALRSQLPDMSKYMLRTDTVKYIENSNAKSPIRKLTVSTEDKATFKIETNPKDNIAHLI